MEREAIIEYLKEVKKIVDEKFFMKGENKYFVMGYQLKNLLKYEVMYNDEELLQQAMYYEDIKTLPLDD